MSIDYTNRKTLLELRNVVVKFNVRGRVLTAIRNVSLDIYEGESLAIVGESGSGKSVLTKTFSGMLETNGFIDQGTIRLYDDSLSETVVELTDRNKKSVESYKDFLNKTSTLERGASEYNAIQAKKAEILHAQSLTVEEEEDYAKRITSLHGDIVDLKNFIQTLDKKDAEDAKTLQESNEKIKSLTAEKETLEKERDDLKKQRKAAYEADTARKTADQEEISRLEKLRAEKIATPENPENPEGLSDAVLERNQRLAYEILLSTGRYPKSDQIKFRKPLTAAFTQAMTEGRDMNDPEVLNAIFETVAFRVEYRNLNEELNRVEGYGIIDCAKVKYTKDWQQIRGRRIATVFQDPMTSLNPVITIGKQITTVIQKHQGCDAEEAKKRAIDIMAKVGIPEPEERFDDYPFQYSGGMRQRIVIAIALSCQPKILICDEPTTALDVTIQAQILELIKQLQRDLGFTVVYITHDLGVVANVAERVAVLYGGQIVEIAPVEEIFYEPKHPYTWALLSSLPQLSEKGTELFSIPGTPPSLYNKIIGDAFAPRNQYAMAIDLVEEPPMFKVNDHHYAKTWLLDPRAPKVEPPANIQNLHEKMLKNHIDYSK